MNSKNKSESSVKQGPGRPRYAPKIPSGKFTFDRLCELNGVDTETGKGENCSALTLRKFLKRDMYTEKGNPRNTSEIVLLKDEKREPDSEKGLGRKALVYIRRDKLDTLKQGKSQGKSSVKSVTVPVADISTPAPAPAPVADAPVAPVADAPVSAPADAPVTA